MKLVTAFLRLVRWPNLLFILITQTLFVYSIVHPVFSDAGIIAIIKGKYFVLLVISSVLIAAAGYIINDYFDLNIDQINKPEKLVVDKLISRRWAIIWHMAFSLVGIAIGFYIDWKTETYLLGVANLICVLLLFIYSISLKKKLLSGNIVISLLTAWVILVVGWCETHNLIAYRMNGQVTGKVLRITFLYSGFAFIISLIREVTKDMEDIDGDRKFGCRTMPISWGIHASKIFVAVWMVVLIAALCIVQFYVLQFKWWLSAAYCILFIIIPLFIILKKLFAANTSEEFHTLSSNIKMVMFSGILSMIFFRIYLLDLFQ